MFNFAEEIKRESLWITRDSRTLRWMKSLSEWEVAGGRGETLYAGKSFMLAYEMLLTGKIDSEED